MKEFIYKINDPMGLHARPATNLVKIAGTYESQITIKRNATQKTANLKRILSVISLSVLQGEEITISISGEDEAPAYDELQSFCQANL
ncbi:MAG TPA: HPr family phosphocarrier protein [Bacillota bacterium]|nr:HPr family phosphocarrier protein [Bacillota bacterium]